ncbi:hypothetical protein PGT21_006185 [Puccinia graminis f. sp. tritici]|uniref:Uncharacterized protein n=1 Tax=Puccinia graminis f. sp. tritici TaxID=56615 RepID=A0A5B0QWX2_PUCGR|nr:hypothetical protein PGT21_006649 [Puccinia graminis f. sp. tritici]KAA1105066.1 hypothetical protein PGTUg99_016159 [Puccinia graminis f. sp. tritici]KAA1117403.1 hypothetical protein PGT21_006185 [Puccinia graminis f. sp. tritici]KAA1123212.1 hypothetical protein PGTUg99_009022 [Puccinia graminis f. sp. tritici]
MVILPPLVTPAPLAPLLFHVGYDLSNHHCFVQCSPRSVCNVIYDHYDKSGAAPLNCARASRLDTANRVIGRVESRTVDVLYVK